MKKRILAAALAVIMLLGAIPAAAADSGQGESPDNPNPLTVTAPTTATDVDSRYDYTKIFDLNNTRYDGRIWTDKTVSDSDLTYTGNVREYGQGEISDHTGRVTITKGSGEDFLVSYSALASTTTVLSETASPIDLVFVLDMSPMSNSAAGKLNSMLTAVEAAVEAMMGLNPNNRVGIVAYSSQAEVLLPLGHYTSVNLNPGSGAPGQSTTVTCTYVEKGATDARSNTFSVSYQLGTPVNKYTQMGIYAGMKLLEEAEELTVTIGGTVVSRQPALILMSEGEPKIASTVTDNPTKSTVQADGTIVTNGEAGLSTTYHSSTVFLDRVEIKRNEGMADINSAGNVSRRHAQTFAAILTAAYMKKEVAAHYHADAMQVYTIGINPDTANAPALARVVLDPRTYLTENKAFAGYVASYTGASKSATLPNAGANNGQTTFGNEHGLTADELRYNDGYYTVAGNDIDWESIFDLVLAQVTSNTAKVPTLTDPSAPDESGWLRYSDPLGEYMELKDVKALIINDVIYRTDHIEGPNENGYYVVNGTATNPVYGTHPLSDIKIYVTASTDGRNMQTVHVEIPAALLPLRQTTIMENVDGLVTSFTHNSAYPLRLVYSVGLQDGVLNSDGSVNLGVVSPDYIARHTVDGRVQFYEGYYSAEEQPGEVGLDNKTIGNAHVSYTPALDNPFYYVDADTPLYTDADCTIPATGHSENAAYYFRISYYEAVQGGGGIAGTEKTLVVSRPGSSIREESMGTDANGALYLKEGAPRLGNLADFRQEKGDRNNTGTADIYLYLYYDEENSEENHSFRIYHGNNGRLSASLPDGVLTVTKQVVNGNDEIQEFSFTITLSGMDAAPGPEGWTAVGEGVYSADFSLKGGESRVFPLSPNVTWAVEETTNFNIQESDHWTNSVAAAPAEGIMIENLTASGTMPAGGRTAVTFTSEHRAHTGTLTVFKKTAGDTTQAGTSEFSFTLTVIENGGETDSRAFTLRNNQSAAFTLSEGAGWAVTEAAPGEHWTTTADGRTVSSDGRTVSGTMAAGQTAQTVTFTNTYTAPGSLLVSKTVNGGDDPDAAYTFTVQIGESTQTLSLRAGESRRYDNLTAGTEWSVAEAGPQPDGWTTTVNGQPGSSVNGTIQSGKTSAASFVNAAPGRLVVSKTAVGGAGSDEAFRFTLEHAGGSTAFTLKGGEQEAFTLPAGARYTVTEHAGTGWKAAVNGVETDAVSGIILAGATTTVPFVNTYESPAVDPDPTPGGGTARYTLSYESNGGTAYRNERYGRSAVVSLNKLPSREGYTFTGWYADQELTERITSIKMTSDKTVYAGWAPTAIPGRLNGTDHFAYVIGYPDGMIRPLANISRAEAAAIFFRLLSPEIRSQNLTAVNGFSDVNAGDWYNTAVSTLASLDILKGRTDTLFAPNAPITRAEFAAICARFDTSLHDGGSSFTDIGGHWAEAEIGRACTLGWINGYEDGTFQPNSRITRAEAMTMVNRVLQRLPEGEDDLLPGMNTWPDNQPDAWYYLAVQEAANSHDFTRKNGIHEQWTQLTADPDWAQYQ